MSKQRPRTASSAIIKSVNARKIMYPKIGFGHEPQRPSSAKEKFEFCIHKRNEDAWKQQDLESNVELMKKREWQTKYHNELSGPKYMEDKILDIKARERKEALLRERRKMLILLFKEDEDQYEVERMRKSKELQKLPGSTKFYPEVEILKSRLQELKHRNEEEYKKISEKLSYEAWRKNNPEIRRLESDRLTKFVQEAWIDQKQWKEDERQKYNEERRKIEMEATKKLREEEEKERKQEEEKQNRLDEWRKDLNNQIILLQNREKEEIDFSIQEKEFEKKRQEIEEIALRRDRLKELRKRKELELFWATQFRLKLKKKASHIQNELLEDETIMEDLLRKCPDSQNEQEIQRIQEAKWMKHVLEEQKKLESMREKEYDLLFSEDAEKMWNQRQADWQREQNARDKLMQEVMLGLQKQIEEKLSATQQSIAKTKADKSFLKSSIEEKQNLIEEASLETKPQKQCPSYHIPHKQHNVIIPTNDKDLRLEQQLQKRDLEKHQKEVQRLENEIKKLWEDSYLPPRYGRKKANW